MKPVDVDAMSAHLLAVRQAHDGARRVVGRDVAAQLEIESNV